MALQQEVQDLTGQVRQMARNLNGLSQTLVPFDNNGDSVGDFLDDLDRHMRKTNITSDRDKLDWLVTHLAGPAKTWYRYQPGPTRNNYEQLRNALQDNYQINDQDKYLARSALYSLTQGTMTVKHFVHHVQDNARGLNMEERDLVSIIINGVHPNIRYYLVMDRPQTTADIIKSPASQPNFGNAANMDPSGSSVLTLQEELRAVRG